MRKREQKAFLELLESEYKAGLLPKAEVYRTQIALETASAQIKSTRYMLASVVVAAIAAIAAAMSAYFAWYSAVQPPH
jgi:outer membrane protein TolC